MQPLVFGHLRAAFRIVQFEVSRSPSELSRLPRSRAFHSGFSIQERWRRGRGARQSLRQCEGFSPLACRRREASAAVKATTVKPTAQCGRRNSRGGVDVSHDGVLSLSFLRSSALRPRKRDFRRPQCLPCLRVRLRQALRSQRADGIGRREDQRSHRPPRQGPPLV